MSQVGETIFITGGTGHVGSVITEFAIVEGRQVRALYRSEQGDAKLRELGATPVRGDLKSLMFCAPRVFKADIVLHLADSFIDNRNPIQYDEVTRIDAAVVDAIAEGLKETDRPLVVTSGALVLAADPAGGETNESSPANPNRFIDRGRSERYAMSLAKKGVRVMGLRLAPYVYGRGGSGTTRTSTVHVDDAARLYLLAADKGRAGEVFNVTSATDITTRQLAEAMATALDIPARNLPLLSKFLTSEGRESSVKTMKAL
ncbi:NAD(P)-binding protein [Polychaeton citri CBS 116435]|uniref:NAD(P)-binding protein n=1 Tax=Polychaeton citri CBS 116435 TaxID=1314669 RepID=A0A9P4UMD6_9PEZI|nr:NAD(P)-binding protein [Polychaeton citri CBS 116435]